MDETVAGRVEPVPLAAFLLTVAPDRLLLEPALGIGATAPVPSRLVAVRRPEAVVKTRRSIARKHARKKGSPPSHAPLTLLAWHLFMTKVPPTIWATATVPTVYPIRWHIELIFQSWKRSLH
jgi:Transposase DDE domain